MRSFAHSQEAAAQVKQRGMDNDLIERIRKDAFFAPVHEDLDELLDPSTFTGRSEQQVSGLLAQELEPALSAYQERLTRVGELSV